MVVELQIVRAVMLEVPPSLLEERRRLGLDKADENWEGVIHMVPPPLDRHEDINDHLYALLRHRAEGRGLISRGGTPGLWRAENSWRVPDQLYARASHRRDDKFWGADMVVEIRSPGDDTYEKIPFYANVGVTEYLIVNRRTKVPELRRLNSAGEYDIDPAGHSTVFDVSFTARSGSLIVTVDAVEHVI